MTFNKISLAVTCLTMAIAPVQGASAAARKSDKMMTLPISEVIAG